MALISTSPKRSFCRTTMSTRALIWQTFELASATLPARRMSGRSLRHSCLRAIPQETRSRQSLPIRGTVISTGFASPTPSL